MNFDGQDFSAALKLLTPGQTAICQRLQQAGFDLYLVGGVVRDFVLGQPVHDVDLATSAQPQEVMALFKRSIPTGIQHGTVTVVSDQGEPVEITTLRSEGAYSDGRHPDNVKYVHDIIKDLSRRDFTVNAMALSWPEAKLIDPFAGMSDLQVGLLRAVGEARRRFDEDSLRLLRALRFVAKLGFAIEAQTLQAMTRCAPGIKYVAAERRREELLRLLAGPFATRALGLAQQSGVLAAMWPDFASPHVLSPILKTGAKKFVSKFDCALLAIDQLEPEQNLLRLVLLLWALGESALTKEVQDNSERSNLDASHAIVRIAECFSGLHSAARTHVYASFTTLVKDLRMSREQQKLILLLLSDRAWTLLLNQDPASEGFWLFSRLGDGELRRFVVAAGGLENYPHFITLLQAQLSAFSVVTDETATEAIHQYQKNLVDLQQRIKVLMQDQPLLSAKELHVDGKVLQAFLQIKAGPQLGHILQKLLSQVQDNPALNKRERLLELASSVLES